ncbi:MAG: DUF2586 family protein, partial [Candidatus Alcyoniella australis]|nr:DUF2586 family protein [Candidatus Alcyoniella australis]
AERIVAVVSPGSVAGVNGTVTAGSGNSGDAVFAAAGTPKSKYEILVEIISGGAFGTATFRWSRDGGINWSPTTTTPAASGTGYSLGDTGVSVSWTDAEPDASSFAAGDTWQFTATAPESSVSEINTAIDYGMARQSVELILVAQPVASGSWAALNTKGVALAAAHKPVAIICDAPWPTAEQTVDQWVTALPTALGSFTTECVSIMAGGAKITDERGYEIERGGSGIYAGRLAHDPVMRSPGRVLTGALAPISGLNKLMPSGVEEAQLQALAEAGFTVFRTYEGLSGYYVNNGAVHCESGSPYINIERVRSMHKLMRTARAAALLKLHDEWYEDGSDASLKDLESAVESEIKTRMMKGRDRELSAFDVVIPTGQDVLGTEEIYAEVQAVPVGATKTIKLYFSLWKQLPQ